MPDAVPLPREERAVALDRIREHLRDERGEEPGELAVLLLFDFVAEQLAPFYFNAGVQAAQHVALRAADSLDAELEATKRPVPSRPRDTSDS
ncbi:MAG: DUF2164 family protein [Dehalococcoidia bacterium]